MLTEVKNQIKVFFLAFKYGVMKEMLNKLSFVMNVLFMVLNNASFILLWIVFYSLKDNIGGSTLNDIMLLWGLAAGSYGISHIFFNKAYDLSETINAGKLDAFLVQPKNVLIQAIMNVSPSAFGDLLYAYILFFITGFTLNRFILYTLFLITGGLILTSVSVIFNSLSFWFRKSDVIAGQANNMLTQFSTYPEGIFNKAVKIFLYTIVPVGIANYMPLQIIINFNLINLFIVIGCTIVIVLLAFIIFYRGLRRYSSSNLMSARI